MTDFYSQNRCVCSTRSHGPLLCAFCLSFHFKGVLEAKMHFYRISDSLKNTFSVLYNKCMYYLSVFTIMMSMQL